MSEVLHDITDILDIEGDKTNAPPLILKPHGVDNDDEEEEDKEEKDDEEEDENNNSDDDDSDNDDKNKSDSDDDTEDDDGEGNADEDEIDTVIQKGGLAQGVGKVSEEDHSDTETQMDEDEDDDDDDDEDENHLQKLEKQFRENVIRDFHPEMMTLSFSEVSVLTHLVRDDKGEIVDPLHKTLPFLTKYEKARVLGERAKQIDAGSPTFLSQDVHKDLVDGYLIANKELEARKIPFIIVRPLPGGCGAEYWKLSDLY